MPSSTVSKPLVWMALRSSIVGALDVERQVLAHARLEDVGLLRDQRRDAAEVAQADAGDAVDLEVAVVRFVEAGQDAHQRALARAARADQGDPFAALQRE